MIVDANVNVGECLYDDWELAPTLRAYQNRMDEIGIDGGIVSPLKPPTFDFESANEGLISAIESLDEFYAVARIDPRVDDAPDIADRLLSKNVVGLKLHPWEETFPITASYVEPVLDVANRHEVPVWIHAGYAAVSHALSIREVALNYPDLPLVLTHGAHLDISGLSLADAKVLARDTDNTYFELSGIYRHDFIQDIVDEVGSERVLFGSNSPYFNPTIELSRVRKADIDEVDRRNVLGESVLSLIG